MHKLLLCTNLAQRRHHLYCSNFGISPISFGQIATSNHDPHTIPGSPTKIVCFCIGSASKQPLPIGVMKCNQGIVVRNFLLRPLRHFNIPKRFAGDFPDRSIEIHRHREPQVLIIPGTSYSHLWSQSSISMTPGSHWLGPPTRSALGPALDKVVAGIHPCRARSSGRLVDSRDLLPDEPECWIHFWRWIPPFFTGKSGFSMGIFYTWAIWNGHWPCLPGRVNSPSYISQAEEPANNHLACFHLMTCSCPLVSSNVAIELIGHPLKNHR